MDNYFFHNREMQTLDIFFITEENPSNIDNNKILKSYLMMWTVSWGISVDYVWNLQHVAKSPQPIAHRLSKSRQHWETQTRQLFAQYNPESLYIALFDLLLVFITSVYISEL